MEQFIATWGTEILLSLITAGALAYCRYIYNQAKTFKAMLKDKENKEIERNIETSLEPIYQELEELREYIRKTEKIEQHHMQLIIASYRYRLIQLCKEFIKQGFMTPKQYDQLIEFYKVYFGLGGNGPAKQYYDKAIALPVREKNDDDDE